MCIAVGSVGIEHSVRQAPIDGRKKTLPLFTLATAYTDVVRQLYELRGKRCGALAHACLV